MDDIKNSPVGAAAEEDGFVLVTDCHIDLMTEILIDQCTLLHARQAKRSYRIRLGCILPAMKGDAIAYTDFSGD